MCSCSLELLNLFSLDQCFPTGGSRPAEGSRTVLLRVARSFSDLKKEKKKNTFQSVCTLIIVILKLNYIKYYCEKCQVCVLHNVILPHEDNVIESLSSIIFIGRDKYKS
jgi:hypothetical protein